jgi:hypothetical protein
MKKGPAPRDLGERFWAKVAKRGPNDCWEWQGTRNAKGYGKVFVGSRSDGTNRKEYAHRIAWRLTHDSEPSPCVLHRCDNPPCCNPAHLFEGTYLDNMRDMAAKGRRRQGEPRRGERHQAAKLTESAVRRILESAASGASLALEYGVTKGLICAIRKRRTWKHVSLEGIK